MIVSLEIISIRKTLKISASIFITTHLLLLFFPLSPFRFLLYYFFHVQTCLTLISSPRGIYLKKILISLMTLLQAMLSLLLPQNRKAFGCVKLF